MVSPWGGAHPLAVVLRFQNTEELAEAEKRYLPSDNGSQTRSNHGLPKSTRIRSSDVPKKEAINGQKVLRKS